jgi:hypothetical protein
MKTRSVSAKSAAISSVFFRGFTAELSFPGSHPFVMIHRVDAGPEIPWFSDWRSVFMA